MKKFSLASFKNWFKLPFKSSSSYSKPQKLLKNASSASSPSALDAENEFFSLWHWTLPALFGLTIGWFGMTCVEVWLENVNGNNRPMAVMPSQETSAQKIDTDSMTAFLRINPFKITPMVAPELEPVIEEAPVQIVGSLATALLKGTSPGLMAWMEDQGKLRLVMLGDSFDVYTLEEVTYLDATFVKGDERITKEIIFSKEVPKVPASNQPLTEVKTAAAPSGPVVPPNAANGTPGAISREMVNNLLENPFDELKKVRLRPSETEQGLQIQWINNDSILSQLGVQKDDVVRAVNGIAFRNAMDITNSLSSLMNSDQFNVEVMRNGAPISLQYVVR